MNYSRKFLLGLWFLTIISCTGNHTEPVVQGPVNRTVFKAEMQQETGVQAEVYGEEMVITFSEIPTGDITVRYHGMETWFQEPNKRVFSVFCNNVLLTPHLDLYAEAGDKLTPVVKNFQFEHDGGPVSIKLEAIANNTSFNEIHILDENKNIIARANAADVKLSIVSKAGIPFRELEPDELVFYNANHSPVGAYATLVYGFKESGGFVTQGGRITSGEIVPGKGVDFACKTGNKTRVMPFYKQTSKLPENVSIIADEQVKRRLQVTTDEWKVNSLFEWTHYSPYINTKELTSEPEEVQKLFSAPGTFMEFKVSGESNLLVGIQNPEVHIIDKDGYLGIQVEENHYAIIHDTLGTILSSPEVSGKYGLENVNGGIDIPASPGQTYTIYIVHFSDEIIGEAFNSTYFYTRFFNGPFEVAQFISAKQDEYLTRCNDLNNKVSAKIQNPYRQFLAGHSTHSYRYNTFLLQKPDGELIWGVPEGQYGYINTFDLVMDQVFFELQMHPWTIRNVLDLYANTYYYHDSIKLPGSDQIHVGGISFCHDMGRGIAFTPEGTSFYEDKSHKTWMTQEELQNWILCAGMYYHKTGNKAWLEQNRKTIKQCLVSMQRRDHVEPGQRDGLTDFVTWRGNHEEITTYDALDPSLKQTRQNLYIAVKSWACYLSLEYMLSELGESNEGHSARESALLVSNTLPNYFKEEGYFPAIFDGENDSKIIPAVEALAYPMYLGMKKDLVKGGEFEPMTSKLKEHLKYVLQPGICLDAKSHGWKLSSTSNNTWQSKVYIAQFVAEELFNLEGEHVNGRVDAIHASFQVIGAGDVAWSDQLNSQNGNAIGSKHYPRGVTSALWWID